MNMSAKLGILLRMVLAGATLATLSALPLSPAEAATRAVTVTITDTGFVPNHLMAVLNQPIRIEVTNNGKKVHQYSIPYYRIFTENLSPGRTSTIDFSPWTAGKFEMTSAPTGKNKPEFSGTFTVTESK